MKLHRRCVPTANVDRGLAPAHAQSANIEVPLVKVHTGQCETDEIYTIAIHGGSVDWRGNHAAKTSYMEPLLTKARSLLASGAHAIDVVEAVISSMEDSAIFNAGKGAIANQAGVIELDASIMDGRKLQAGAVAAVTTLRNPIIAARLVMDKSEHVMMVGPNADRFIKEIGGVVVNPAYFLHGGQNFSDVPLPANFAITPLDDDVSSDKAGFLGVWGGVWNGDLNHVLVVEEIEAEVAKVIYAYKMYPFRGEGL